ncbi:MAG TPA: SRPBCC domain-containing protein [Tahibacter sp.]|uniref:SRPBCC domain-containing protein n=1 Tax=Tahibacter sp. TaxID=2056211 RepID=UPI002CA52EDE|nr:SRPBCC domain-containing protein [Tahibacter sp.]HSX62655.1 SRPBCC domain-containing protein [Tahibacter sp.]
MVNRTLVAAALLSSATLAPAAVKQSSPEGFVVEHRLMLNSTPEQAWATLAQPARWWPKEHTWSGDPANLSLELKLGGCFCERWKDGGAEHGRVVMIRRNELVRLNAALGPMQEMAISGVLTIAIAAKDEGTEAIVTYRVSGTPAHAFEKMAPVVDQVVGLQFGGWAAYEGEPKKP